MKKIVPLERKGQFLPGGPRNKVFSTNGHIYKRLEGEGKEARFKRELSFALSCPYSPEVITFNPEETSITTRYLKDAHQYSLNEILKSTSTVNSICKQVIKMQESAGNKPADISYTDQAQCLLQEIDSPIIHKHAHRFRALDNKEKHTLVHGDLWSGNILISKGKTYFIDGENEEVKDQHSNGHHALDLMFFLHCNGLWKPYQSNIPENSEITLKPIKLEDSLNFIDTIWNYVTDEEESLTALAFNLTRKMKRAHDVYRQGFLPEAHIKIYHFHKTLAERIILKPSKDTIKDTYAELLRKQRKKQQKNEIRTAVV